MGKQLTKKVRDMILRDRDLFYNVGEQLDIQPGSLMNALNRNSRRLVEHSVVVVLSEMTGLRPSEIEENRPQNLSK